MKTFFVKGLRPALLALLALGALSSASPALADPPARVGNISYVQGEVDFRPAYEAEATPVWQNWPLTSHNVITTGPDARAELRVGSTAIRLDADSELEIAELDDQRFHLRLLQGSLNARVRNPELVRDFELNTAQGQLSLSAPSQLHVDAGRRAGTTVVSLFAGAARFDAAHSSLMLVAGQRAVAAGGSIQIGTAARDDFDFWSLARDQQDDRAVASRYVSPETTGYEALDQYGTWDTSDDYGAVWIPSSVPVGWAPYRDGRWAWIAPWGWTWIDRAPWGYAPFHYGRWAWYRQRWCWVPGRAASRPVWAPALVGWVGGQNWSAHFSSGTAPAVGWFPLAPHEAYRPAYTASPGYLRQLNGASVDRAGNPAPQAIYRNRVAHDAVTVIPHERFQHGRTVAVGNAPALIGPAQQLAGAPLSVVVPATIAQPPSSNTSRTQRPLRVERRARIAELPDQPRSTAPPAALAPPRQPIQPVQPMQPVEPQPIQPVQPVAPLRQTPPPSQLVSPALPRQERAPLRPQIHPHPRPLPEQRQWQPHGERRAAPAGAGVAVPPVQQGQPEIRRGMERREGNRPQRDDGTGSRGR